MGRFFARTLVTLFAVTLLALWAHVARQEARLESDPQTIDAEFVVVDESDEPLASDAGPAVTRLPGLPSDPLAPDLPDPVLMRVAEDARAQDRIHGREPAGELRYVASRNPEGAWRVSHDVVDAPHETDRDARLHSTQVDLALPVAKQLEARGGVRMDFVNHAERGPEGLAWAPTAGFRLFF